MTKLILTLTTEQHQTGPLFFSFDPLSFLPTLAVRWFSSLQNTNSTNDGQKAEA